MCLFVRIVMSSSGKATFGQVSKLMNMAAMKLMKIEPNDTELKERWGKLIFLMNGHSSFDP